MVTGFFVVLGEFSLLPVQQFHDELILRKSNFLFLLDTAVSMERQICLGAREGDLMSLFVWTQSLATGNPFVDAEHQELVRHVNGVLEAIARKQGGADLCASVEELQDFAREHFSREEREMEHVAYKFAEYHFAAHAELLKQLQEMHDKLQSGQRFEPMAMYRYLTWWVKDHIRLWDVPLAKAMAEREHLASEHHFHSASM